ncbi:PREDICTED: uncharacterized protein LOC105362576 [Ceratosolen solmsi marchali]|uniref:Uncharacterized protein LOC105362576 n=1 Tax=Ceratosolen solmsi marchali TaxID=326594 RepID=A0AAJ6YHU7_9HYME|nr:PREDICTED: uncharacterized protein LOC105362576 [Ceratosolen solmsi marchali]
MLTVMCPNCRHRFPAPDCCNTSDVPDTETANIDLQPHSVNTSGGFLLLDATNCANDQHRQQVTISTQCGIQSGGCLIQSNNAEVVVLASTSSPRLEVRSKLSGGGCLVQKRPEPCAEELSPLLIGEELLRSSFERATEFHRSHSTAARLEAPPSGCQELPGTRRNGSTGSFCDCRCCCYCRCCYPYHRGGVDIGCRRNLCQVTSNNGTRTSDDACHRNVTDSNSKYPGDVRIQLNATVRLPSVSTTTATLGSCTLNITASATSAGGSESSKGLLGPRNSLNGGGIVSGHHYGAGISDTVNRDESPWIPMSLMSACPWECDTTYLPEKDVARLAEVRRLLQTCGWYHEGLSWQQSENLLKDAPVGRWLMRDSSDSRYTFAISVQTARGPTSVRVFYFMGKFRLDAEPRLALTMPLFDCPIKMLEYYCEYSKHVDDHRQEVWLDYSGQIYSQIYLSEPLVKEVRSLSQLARIAVNQGSARLEKDMERLPPVIRNYLKEYPYTL